MKHFVNRWLLLFVLLLGMSALACNLPFGGEAEPTPRPTRDDNDDDRTENDAEEEVQEELPEEAPEEVVNDDVAATAVAPPAEEVETSEADSGLFSDLFAQSVNVRDTVQQFDSLESYQMQLDFSTTVNDATQLVQATILVSVDPPQREMTFSFSGLDELDGMDGMETMSMIQIGETSYVDMAGFGCITTSEGDFANDEFGMLDANEFLGNVGEASLVGEERINGIETLHYTFNESALGNEMTDFSWAQGDVYIAKEGNFLVRFRLEGEGIVDDFEFDLADPIDDNAKPQIGLIIVEMNLTNINEPVNVTVPEACESGSLGGAAFPVLDDAYESSSFGGFATYKTDASFAEAVSFYQTSLAADGWVYQENDSFIFEGTTALMFFEQDGRSLTVTISEDSNSSALLVVIFEE